MTLKGKKDFYAGLMFMIFGAGFLWVAQDYPFGTARRMGAAFFPIILSLILIGFGAIISIRGLLSAGEPPRGFTLKGLFLVIVSTLLFAVLVRGAGLAAATFILVCVSAVASARFHWKPTLVSAVGLTIFCVAVFIYGLGLPMPAIGSWFGH